MLDEIATAVAREFSDLPDVAGFTRVAVRLLTAAVLGAVIGYERERKDSAAGLRTHTLVSLAAAVFVFVPLRMGMNLDGLSRVLQGVIAGAGFLGAGAVLKLSGEGEIRGLTTAAGLWLTVAVDLAVGMGQEAAAVLSTVLGVAILTLMGRIDRWIHRGRDDER